MTGKMIRAFRYKYQGYRNRHFILLMEGLSVEIEHILGKIIGPLSQVQGVIGVVLGGSRARGTNRKELTRYVRCYHQKIARLLVIN